MYDIDGGGNIAYVRNLGNVQRKDLHHVIADWVREGDPGQVLSAIVASAGLEVGRTPLRIVGGPSHFTGHDAVGLRAAAARVPVGLRGEEE